MNNVNNIIIKRINNYYFSQWKQPKRLLFKGFGFSIWKWCDVFIPLFIIHIGSRSFIGYDIHYNGVGIKIHFPPIEVN